MMSVFVPALMMMMMMMMMIPLPSASHVQSWEVGSLRGIQSMKVVVEQLDDDARRCGLTPEDLEQAASRPLLNGGIQIDPNTRLHMYVKVSVLTLDPGLCVAHMEASVRASVEAVMPNNPQPVFVTAVVWSSGKLLSGPRLEFPSRVTAWVRQAADDFVTKVKSANAKTRGPDRQ